MELVLVGLTHRTAPVAIRERLALTSSELATLLDKLTRPSNGDAAPLAEAAILSTCNRFEVYGVADDGPRAPDRIRGALAERSGIAPDELCAHLTTKVGEEVVWHLCAVAAGLDSMILGEPQILGQVTEAHQVALAAGAAGPVLGALFREAIHCGKRARSETAISERAASVSHAAVELAKQIFGALGDRKVLLIGAGEMAELAARNLADNGAGRILVVNRSRERAEALAGQFDGQAYGWDALGQALREADIVVCSAAAPHTVIHPAAVHAAMAARRDQPLFLIDIAVPRNVDAEVGQLANVYLYDIDDLKGVVEENLEQRQREVPKVEAIVAGCSADFTSWLCGLDVATTIRDLYSVAGRVRDDEVDRALRRLGPLSEHQERVVRILAHNIVSKLLHTPTARLKELAEEGNGWRSAGVLRDLFGLPGSYKGEGHG